MDELWKAVLAEIEVEVSKPTFHTFFKGTQLLSIVDNVATIAAVSPISINYLDTRYYSLIKRLIDKHAGQSVSLLFVTKGISQPQAADMGPLFARPIEEIRQARPRPARIRQDYTFDNLAVSESNQLAYTACLAVSQNPGTKYNPVFLYGTVGVGKTHLMHAVANKVFDERDTYTVSYLTTEEFTNEVVEAILNKTTVNIRKKYRNVDLLLLDDIQFLSGKDRVQEELFHTFNTLIDRGSQIIFSSDRPPSEIKKIEARLASRFEGGLTVDIQAPDFELRTAILLIKSKKYDLNLDVEMAKLIAERVTDARALEGFLLKVSSVTPVGTPVTEKSILTLLGKTPEKSTVLHPDTIIDTVCRFYNIRATQLKGAKRDASLVRPRHICMYLLKEETGLSYVEIGNLLGGRDHTTVMHGVEKMRKSLSNEKRVIEDISVIKQQISEHIN